jgi:glycosyltransferase involved in cell wall biosynthesis
VRIAIDGYELNRAFTGVGRYLLNLLEAMLNIDGENEYTVFLKENSENSDILAKFDNLETVVLKSEKSHTKWQNSDLIKALNSGNYDIFFSPNHSIPLLYKNRSFMTVHDPSWKTMKNDYSLKERLIRDMKTRISIRKVEKVFTVSEFSRLETLKFYKIKESDIISIHSGVETSFKRSPEKEIKEFKKKFGIQEKNTIGFLGSMFKRRHIKEIIKAFNILKKKMPLQLILIGNDYYQGEINRLLSSESIIWKQRIEEEDINKFYSSLDLFLYISDYEGFGFPPLEALKCGTPSILLKTSSLKEVFSDIAFFIEDAREETIVSKIKEVIGKDNKSKSIFENFEKKDRYYSWERAAREYLKYFK